MTDIVHWTAARSGAAITVTGKSPAGDSVKIADIRLIRPSQAERGVMLAHTRDGDIHRLLPDRDL